MGATTFDASDPLSRVAGETAKANLALRDYAMMGPGRSLDKLLDRYQSAAEERPTMRRATLVAWSTRYAWQARVEALDAAFREQMAKVEVTERLKSHRRRVKRLEVLGMVADKALAQFNEKLAKKTVTLGDVARAIEIANRGLAAEYGDDPLSRLLDLLADLVGEEKVQRIAAVIAEGEELPQARCVETEPRPALVSVTV